MGVLFYGGPHGAIEIDDRALAHLKLVVTTKLRRGESFTLSWVHPDGQSGGRSTIWLHPSIPLRFLFDDPEPTQINTEWLEQLASSAHSTGGIQLVAEHFETTPDAETEWPAP
ncbi:DUF7882 family protein [Microbacterium sp. No. 7]|uniref:DUF7882 family protein n=1 Tax=Microbacterium sp. No. 7 TaxID=1714373 RepID=UPI0006CF698A|nr:hypothetical protein [Microbacterium sp. No. 7]ALJ20538.1 hypothetical protein AOA12_11740 [Microbacterium sp. No. 7]